MKQVLRLRARGLDRRQRGSVHPPVLLSPRPRAARSHRLQTAVVIQEYILYILFSEELNELTKCLTSASQDSCEHV